MKVYGMDKAAYQRLEPFISIPPAPAIPIKDTKTFELNAADTARLQGIYGVGPVYAARIARYRDLLGGFYSTEQLKEVYGLSGQQYREISQQTFVDTGLLKKMDLDIVDRETLARHPYLTPYQADAILAYREFKGGWNSLNEILTNGLLPDSVFRRVMPYLKIANQEVMKAAH
jgi:DNA uptake protein ComE-like DNA-binding protein